MIFTYILKTFMVIREHTSVYSRILIIFTRDTQVSKKVNIQLYNSPLKHYWLGPSSLKLCHDYSARVDRKLRFLYGYRHVLKQ